MVKVALEKCESYDIEEVRSAVNASFSDLGGLENFVKSGQTVLIKANLLNNFKIETATTTHPSVVQAVAEELIKLNCKVVIGDSSGGFYNKMHMGSVYKVCGMTDVAEKTGAELNGDFGFTEVKFDGGVAAKHFEIINCALNCDAVINLAKLKTHQLTMYTGCVKNLFGLIPGLQKVQMHSQNPDLMKFIDFIIDVNEFMKPKVVINMIDAVIGMEGDGPSAGKPRKVGRIISSVSPYAADLAGITLMNGKVDDFPQVVATRKRGITPNAIEEIEVIGENLEKSKISGYKLVKDDKLWDIENSVPKGVRKPAVKLMAPYPWVNRRKCKGCKKCFEHCPNHAITMVDGKASFDLSKCIRCYCCQELCPYHLIKVKRSFLARLLRRL